MEKQMDNWEINIVRSGRRTLCARVLGRGVVEVRAPYRVSRRKIDRFLEKYRDRLAAAMEKMRPSGETLSAERLRNLAAEAARVIPPIVDEYCLKLGVTRGRITIRAQRTRWGSCSAKGNLNFNCLLMLMPRPVLEYVVIHEVCHRLEMNHSDAFWNLVGRLCPDYKERRKRLKELSAEYTSLLPR